MKLLSFTACLIALIVLPAVAVSQKKQPEPPRAPQLVRTVNRHDLRRLGYGGTLTVIGPPDGSITIEGWQRNEVDISAEIELRADTEKDLDMLAAVNTFVVDEDLNHLRILTTGTHDLAFMKRVAKKFPKNLMGLPWRITYRIKVPQVLDLEVNAGRGPVNIMDIEGNARISSAGGITNIRMTGGTLSATVGIGNVTLEIPVKSWRGVGADFRVATGDITVKIPPGFSGDFDADVLGAGKIENSVEGLTARENVGPTTKKVKLRAGAGGSAFVLTVVNGTIRIEKRTEAEISNR
jgi:hypothetical protein